MDKQELIDVFKDTEKIYSSKSYDQIVESNKKKTYIFKTEAKKYSSHYEKPMRIKVSNLDTLSAAKQYAKMADIDDGETIVCILNFASATTPGGGVLKGSSAQEENLCRRTTLYPALNQQVCWDEYYNINRKNNTNIGSDTVIYTQDVLVFKDKDYNVLPKEEMFYTDVITCAAPNLREKPNNQYNEGASKEQLRLTNEELYDIHVKRARCILNAALQNGVTHLILGAFGCGAFQNDPATVARAYKDVLKEYTYDFEVVEFAIIGKNNNFEIFNKILKG